MESNIIGPSQPGWEVGWDQHESQEEHEKTVELLDLRALSASLGSTKNRNEQ